MTRRIAPPALACLLAMALVRCSSSTESAGPGATPPTGADTGVATGSTDGSTTTTDGSAEASCSNDVAVDPKNCGTCGHDCLGGACLAGLCQPIVLAYDRARPIAVALDATHVYWLEPGGLALGRAPKAGGSFEVYTGVVVGDLAAKHLRVDDARVYWSDALKSGATSYQTHQYGVPTGGLDAGPKLQYGATGLYGGIGAPVLGGLALDGTDVVFAGPASVISRQPKDGGALSAVAFLGGGAFATTIAAEDGGIVYGTYGGEVYRRPSSLAPDASPGTPIATGQGEVEELVLAGTDMFWINVDTGTIKIAKNGTAVDIFAAALDAPEGLAVDDTNVYWTEKTTVRSCPRSGCGAGPRTIARDQPRPSGIAIDTTSVYWANASGGTVVKVAK